MKGEPIGRRPRSSSTSRPTPTFRRLRGQGGAAPRGVPATGRRHDAGRGRRHPHRVGGPLRADADAGRGAADHRLAARRVPPPRPDRRSTISSDQARLGPIELKLSEATRLRRLSRDAIWKEDARQVVVPIPRGGAGRVPGRGSCANWCRRRCRQTLEPVGSRAVIRPNRGSVWAVARRAAISAAVQHAPSNDAAATSTARRCPATSSRTAAGRRRQPGDLGVEEDPRPAPSLAIPAAACSPACCRHGDAGVPRRERRGGHRADRQTCWIAGAAGRRRCPSDVADLIVDRAGQQRRARADGRRGRRKRGCATSESPAELGWLCVRHILVETEEEAEEVLRRARRRRRLRRAGRRGLDRAGGGRDRRALEASRVSRASRCDAGPDGVRPRVRRRPPCGPCRASPSARWRRRSAGT